MRRLMFATLVLSLAAPCALAQRMPDFSKMELKATPVAGSVYVIEDAAPQFSGGNIGVSVGEDGLVLVDDKFAPLAAKVEAALDAITDKPIKFVINTHFHSDHTDGNKAFGAKSTIIAHDRTRERLLTNTKDPILADALPVVTFKDAVSVHLNGEEIRAFHVPAGHTDTDVIVHFTKSNVVHMGDHFFNGTFPYFDNDGGGDIKGYAANIERLLGEIPPDAKIIPGHGPLATVEDLRKFHKMMVETTAIVEAGVKAGKNARKMKSEKVLAAYSTWGKGFLNEDAYIDLLYKDLTRKK